MECKIDRLSDKTVDSLVHREHAMHRELLDHFGKEEQNFWPQLIPPWYVVEIVHRMAHKEQQMRLNLILNEHPGMLSTFIHHVIDGQDDDSRYAAYCELESRRMPAANIIVPVQAAPPSQGDSF